jgi:hypothetical protein
MLKNSRLKFDLGLKKTSKIAISLKMFSRTVSARSEQKAVS